MGTVVGIIVITTATVATVSCTICNPACLKFWDDVAKKRGYSSVSEMNAADSYERRREYFNRN